MLARDAERDGRPFGGFAGELAPSSELTPAPPRGRASRILGGSFRLTPTIPIVIPPRRTPRDWIVIAVSACSSSRLSSA